MSTVKVFVSFEFGKDNDLKDSFYKQAEEQGRDTGCAGG